SGVVNALVTVCVAVGASAPAKFVESGVNSASTFQVPNSVNARLQVTVTGETPLVMVLLQTCEGEPSPVSPPATNSIVPFSSPVPLVRVSVAENSTSAPAAELVGSVPTVRLVVACWIENSALAAVGR